LHVKQYLAGALVQKLPRSFEFCAAFSQSDAVERHCGCGASATPEFGAGEQFSAPGRPFALSGPVQDVHAVAVGMSGDSVSLCICVQIERTDSQSRV
jgi:hypothetical protein